MDMGDQRGEGNSTGFAEADHSARASAAAGYVLDDNAVASVIAHASRIIATGLQPVGQGLVAGGFGGGSVEGCGQLMRAAIQIDAVTALHRRLARPRPFGVSIEAHCRELGCDLVLALGRLDIMPRVAMCEAPLSLDRSVRLAILVVELMAGAINRNAQPGGGGTVWVTLKPVLEGRLELSVVDNFGPSVADTPGPRPHVGTLVEALCGELVPGAGLAGEVRIRFPLG
jgi:hypothetical protein